MNLLNKSLLVLLLNCAQAGIAEDHPSIQESRLDEHTVYTIPVSRNRITTISFPGPIAAIDAANVTNDPKLPGQFQIAHTKGSYFFSLKALAPQATTNLNVRWNNKTYVIELIESPSPVYSVIFQYAVDERVCVSPSQVSPNRLMALLDKAKAYPLLKSYYPETVAQIGYLNYAAHPRIMDYKDYEIQLEEVFRFNPEDTLIFRVILRNKTEQAICYPSDGFSLRVGERTYSQSLSDASGTIPPKSETPAYFAITSTPNGGRNDLSLKNEFTVILDHVVVSTPPQEPVKDTPEQDE